MILYNVFESTNGNNFEAKNTNFFNRKTIRLKKIITLKLVFKQTPFLIRASRFKKNMQKKGFRNKSVSVNHISKQKGALFRKIINVNRLRQANKIYQPHNNNYI